MDIYKNYDGTYYTEIEWHDGKPDLNDTSKLEKAKKFSNTESIFSDKYFRISYEEEYKNTLKYRRKEKLKRIDESR